MKTDYDTLDITTLRVRDLPVVSLDVGFAVELPSGRIAQYFVPLSTIIASKNAGSGTSLGGLARDKLVRYLEKNPPVAGPYALQWEPNMLDVERWNFQEIPSEFLPREVKRALRRKTGAFTLLQENVWRPSYLRFFAPLFHIYNMFATLINTQVLERLYGMDFFLDRKTPLLRYVYAYRTVYPTINMAIRCGEEDLTEAFSRITNDLKTLQKWNVIKGSFIMPCVRQTVNTVGNDKKVFVVFAMPYVDVNGIAANPDPLKSSTDPQNLKRLGLTTATYEGQLVDIVPDKAPYSDLVERKVTIGDTHERLHKDVQDQWEKTIDNLISNKSRRK